MAEIASAFVTLLPSARGFGSKLESEVGSDVRGSGKRLGATFGKMFAVAGGLLAAAGIGGFLKDSIGEAREAQKVGALTESIIKSTGGAAKISAVQVGNLASAISLKTGVDDEAIQSGANLLLTFKNVRNEVGEGNKIFNRATRAASDLSAAGFGDLNGASKQLGKALNDPIKGMTALSRSGVTFTEQQQAQVKALVESGDALSAQKIILGEVESQVGGAAAASATAGEKAAVAFGNLKEQIGTALLPVVDRVATTLTSKVIPAISTFVTQIQTGEGAGGRFAAVCISVASALAAVFGFISANREGVGAFVAVIGTAVIVAKAFAAAQVLVNIALTANPIGIVVVAIAGLVAGLVIAYKKSDTFRAVVDKLFAGLKRVWAVLMNNKQAFLALLGPVGLVAAVLITAYRKSETFRNGVNAVVGAVKTFGSTLVGAVEKVARFQRAVAEKGAKVVDFFVKLPGKITNAIGDPLTMLKTIGEQIVTGLKNGISGAWHLVTDEVGRLIDKIPGKIRNLMGIASPSKVTMRLGRFISQGLALGITAGGPEAEKAMSKAAKKVQDALEDRLATMKDKLQGFKNDFASIVSSVAEGFRGNLFESTTGAGFIDNLLTKRADLQSLLGAFKKLVGWGLSPGFLGQLFQSGNGALILDLAAGDKATAMQGQGLFGQVTSLSNQLGNQVAGLDVGLANKMDNVRDEIKKTNRKLDNLADRTGRAVGREINSAASKGKRNQDRGGGGK